MATASEIQLNHKPKGCEKLPYVESISPTDPFCPGGARKPGQCKNPECPMYLPSLFESGGINKGTPARPKSMRLPARPLCMLEIPDYNPPLDDYNELSRFIRMSTVPGYSRSDTITEYNGNHNQRVWENPLKERTKTCYNFKRDWLSNWGEFNVKEQRWRKAWVEKYGADKK